MADPADNVSILIDGKSFRDWTEIDLEVSLDCFSSITVTAPFEPKLASVRAAFRPFSFNPIEVSVDDELLFRGTLLDPSPKLDEAERSLRMSGYALPGVLNDCETPASRKPFELRNVGLRAIFEYFCEPFGLAVEIEGDEGAKFKKVRPKNDEKLLTFLTPLANQRGFVITNSTEGAVRLWRSISTGSPAARFVEGEAPLASVDPQFKSQEYHSEVTAYAPGKAGKTGGQWTEQNPFLGNRRRPHSFILDDTEKGDAPSATKAKLGRMFGNMASWSLPGLPGLRDGFGRLWQPNRSILLTAPGAYVNHESELVVRQVKFSITKESRSSTLEVVLPGSFSGEVPTKLPWVD
ncbi:MAG TPA: hypothetical protein VGK73_20945 [Polyangiaceae bacterium]